MRRLVNRFYRASMEDVKTGRKIIVKNKINLRELPEVTQNDESEVFNLRCHSAFQDTTCPVLRAQLFQIHAAREAYLDWLHFADLVKIGKMLDELWQCGDVSIEDSFEDYLNEQEGEVCIMGRYYDIGSTLRELDKDAFEEELEDFKNANLIEDHNGIFWQKSEIESLESSLQLNYTIDGAIISKAKIAVGDWEYEPLKIA